MKLNEPVKIFPGAQVIGDVEIGENCSIWHGWTYKNWQEL